MEFFNTIYYGNTVLEWLISLSLVAVSFIVGRIVYWVFGRVVKGFTSKTKTQLDDIIIDQIEEPIVAFLVLLGTRYAITRLDFGESAVSVENFFVFVGSLIICWLIIRLYDSFHTHYLEPLAARTATDLDDQLMPILRSAIRFIVLSLGVVIGLNNAGYDVRAVLAGLGIGYLAFALAAQDTIANVFGGITIFVQKPFTLGDRIRVSEFSGFVRSLGLRSSQLETLSGETILIPNKYFIDYAVTNLDVANYYYQAARFNLHRGMSIAEVERALGILHDAIVFSENIAWVIPKLDRAGDYGYEVLIEYGVKRWEAGQYWAHHGHKLSLLENWVNLSCLKALELNGIKLAVPILNTQRTVIDLPQSVYGYAGKNEFDITKN